MQRRTAALAEVVYGQVPGRSPMMRGSTWSGRVPNPTAVSSISARRGPVARAPRQLRHVGALHGFHRSAYQVFFVAI
ncbi:MAG: hypothetical protein J7465_04130 [Chloroflexus sp.]|nr:hypothetical protein [Chloroflexus sp.]MBO9373374.1 hypothetical protein [Chloroflexus sp.]